jgi:exopolyphosphatase/guanosine-5'-triphosphate,3'-diphosphate pyrophosphatase
VRDAENGEAFLGEIEWSYGFTTRLLDGNEEAAMMYEGVLVGRPPLEDVLIVDIGGGSTELVLGSLDGPGDATSLDIGCVRLTERFLRSDPPTGPELAAAATYVRGILPNYTGSHLIGVAGTVTTLAALDLGLAEYDPEKTHGHRIPLASVQRELSRLASMTIVERTQVSGIEPGRAAVIVAGLVILREVMDAHGSAEIEASERDILDGAALAAARLPEPEEGPAPPGAYTCC